MERFDFIEDFLMPAFMFFLVVAGIAAVVLGITAGIREEARWNAYKSDHNCRIVQQVSGSTGVGVTVTTSPNGGIGVAPTTISVPGKTGWLCDDGVTYWR